MKDSISFADFESRYDQILKQTSGIFVLDISGEVVGFVKYMQEQKFSPDKQYLGHLEDLFIKDEMRGRGYGIQLAQYCLGYLKRNDCYKIVLTCEEHLCDFYRKVGFIKQKYSMEFLNL